MSKNLLIIESSAAAIVVDKKGNNYVLSGTFTEFGIKNVNNRIYEESEILPHIEELKQKIKAKSLLGELDHPAGFDISLKNVSHVIESLEYDKANRRIVGKIRLLDTTAGKEAKALVDAGIPLHISSRAAGVVENDGRVKMRKMFTYDLVANPGFANAQLALVNESYGYKNDGRLFIYEVNDEIIEEKTSNNTMNDNFVTRQQMDSYTRDWKKSFDDLKESVSEKTSSISDKKIDVMAKQIAKLHETVNNLIAHNDHLVSELNSTEFKLKNYEKRQRAFENYSDTEIYDAIEKMQEQVNSVKSTVSKLVAHNDHIVEEVQKTQQYLDYMAEEINENDKVASQRYAYLDYLAEKLDQSIQYSEHITETVNNLERFGDYLAENLEKSINHSDYLAENLENSIKYAEHIAKNTNDLIRFADYLSESLEESIRYSEHIAEHSNNLEKFANYLAESLDESIQYSEYLKENIQDSHDYLEYLGESLNENEKSKNSASLVESADYSNIDKKLDSILSSSMKRKEEESTKTSFLQYLLETQRNRFSMMSGSEREEVISAFDGRKITNFREAQAVFESVVNSAKEEKWISSMPAKYRPLWDKLTESQKNIIKAQASMRLLESNEQIEAFWKTRDLTKFERSNVFGDKIIESDLSSNSTPEIENDPKLKRFFEEMQKRFNGPTF